MAIEIEDEGVEACSFWLASPGAKMVLLF